jgi:phage gp36-like protein
MSAYCTLIDLKNYAPRDVIQQLTDDEDTDQIDQEKVDFCIKQASDLIDGYMRGRYPTPLVTVPDMITDVAVKLTMYFLYKRSLMVTLPDPIKNDYDFAVMILRDIQKGRVSPFEIGQNPTWFGSNKATGSVSVVNANTNYWNDYLVRAPGGANQRFISPGTL